ncbi:MAG: 1,4-alpha-glucan branching protein GlgB [Lachnospiraceae bacterium]
MNLQDFYNGNEWFAWEYFGAHIKNDGVEFRTYAPFAAKVTLIGEFNTWHEQEMELQGRGGIYFLKVANAKAGQMYKYRIYHRDGGVVDKADPYGFLMELRPASASIIVDKNDYYFQDQEWMCNRDKGYHRPINIYEIHFGTWKAKGDRWYRYDELGEVLILYLKEMGFTHVEIMPLNEHPFDGSWGYQSTGFFAPTSRYGTPKQLKQFVNDCHRSGIGVILDFVMVHFAVDDYGLSYFDGAPLYELPFGDVEQSEWGTHNFAHGKGEVASFLKSCANYWLSEFHFDGLRIDAVSNIIYWGGDAGRGVNQASLSFVQSFNEGLHNFHPGVLLIAEDSSSYLKVTAPVQFGGLGFDYKWDLGFMHDTFEYFKKSPVERRNHYSDLLFSMHYFYNELYMLAFSHDENVHGKKTVLDKMYGSYEEKFAQCRALYLYMMSHPGKKLNFMGNEIGQFREWDENRPQDFDVLLEYPMHQMFQRFFRDLSRIYISHPALYEGEYNSNCFHYIVDDKPEDLVYAYERSAGGERILAIFNFCDAPHDNYEVKLSGNHKLEELICSDWMIYGGCLEGSQNIIIQNGRCYMDLPAYCGRLFVVW